MLIDPFVVGAQIVNFGLLIWLLRRFLYGPVTRAMHAREERIRAETAEARRLRADAAVEGERYRELVAGFEAEREARLAEIGVELELLRHERVRAVRAEIEAMRERWRRALEQEQTAFYRQLRQQVGQESLAVIRHALRDLADSDLEDRLVTRFIERLRALAPEDRARLRATDGDGQPPLVRTALTLSGARRAALEDAVAELFDGAVPHFRTDPALLAGVELRAGGVKVAWTLDEYLQSLEEAVRGAPATGPAADAGSWR